jgi:ribosomal protein L5
MNRIRWYCENIASRDMLFKFPFLNMHQIPKFKKINLNLMTKTAIVDKKKILPILCGLEMISGQKSQRTYAQKSIASFKLRAGQLLGATCTLRKKHMYEFLDKFSFIILPKVRDFQGFLFKDSYSLNCSGQSFLLYSELENHYEYFEGIKNFQISLNFYSKKKILSFPSHPQSSQTLDLKSKTKLDQKTLNHHFLYFFIPI